MILIERLFFEVITWGTNITWINITFSLAERSSQQAVLALYN